MTSLSLSCIGEGNGNPLQCSCLENPRDAEGWWAAVYGVTQSRTGLKRLSSSSRIKIVSSIIKATVLSREDFAGVCVCVCVCVCVAGEGGRGWLFVISNLVRYNSTYS